MKIYALAPDYTDQLREQVRVLGAIPIDFDMRRAKINPLADAIATLQLTFLLQRLKPDITFAYSIKPVIFGTVAAWLARIPKRVGMIEGLGYVYTIDENRKSSFKRKLLKAIVSWLYKIALFCCNQVIFLNPDDVSEFVQARIVDKNKVIQLGGIGVDLDYWSLHSVPIRPLTFMLAARILREKGIEEFARAAKIVKTNHPDTRFVLLGALDSNPGSLTHDEVQAWVDTGILEWIGHADMKSWLEHTSVYVLPSFYREGVPRSTQEAMAMGKPVITTDVPGCRETVVDNVNGFMVPPRDVDALVNAMLRFVENPQLLQNMGQQSRRIAEEKFNVHQINKRLIKILLGETFAVEETPHEALS